MKFSSYLRRKSGTFLRIFFLNALTVTVLGLTACGFHLRGAYTFPFTSASIEVPGALPEIALQLKRTLESEGKMRIVDAKAQPQVRVRVLEVASDKRILSLSSGGKVREYLIEQRIKFDVVDAFDRSVLPETTLTATREFSYSDAQALAKEGEERMLRGDMQSDLVAQMLRQLQAADPAKRSRP